ncbi:hypothetical protein [Bradyrhizobium sp. SRS-191]|uniref:hypothetical protein n=1 Tax=Bradyrhizobium sp. SRS-191 TaxID=2962606 RepID=UPI00211E4C5B|nr:hypothetical protein [Bradyrhizobium sp. SRS-191]
MSDRPWTKDFQIQSVADLDFVIGQSVGFPVGMSRKSAPEFRRRVLAALLSHRMGLSSIDYVLKRYVEPGLYEDENVGLGDEASDFLRGSVDKLMRGLRDLHTANPGFGVFGAEITLYRLPHSLDAARLLSNRGLLLEVVPILRLCFEMMSWANAAFYLQDEDAVVGLKAQSCITSMKEVYATAGKIYGYLSTFSHWVHTIHEQFIQVEAEQVSVLNASVRYRAMALGLCLVITDVLLSVIHKLYKERSEALITSVQGVLGSGSDRKAFEILSRIEVATGLKEMREIKTLVQ